MQRQEDPSVEALRQAMTLHRAGQLAEAARLYETILDGQPAHFDALRLLSVIHLQNADWARAAELGRRAVAANPGSAIAQHNLANAYAELGEWPEALAHAERSVALDASFAPAQARLGFALHSVGRSEEALAAFDAALALKPDAADAHLGRGVALRTLGRSEEAIASYDAALVLRPNYLEAHSNRGNALMDLERCEEALVCFDAAVALKPGLALGHSNRANALLNLERPEEALASCDMAIAIDPVFATAHYNRGMALAALKRLDEAVASFEAAIALRPDDATYRNNYGMALAIAGRAAESLEAFDAVLALDPGYEDAHWNRAVRLLTIGRFEEGWAEYEHRWLRPAFVAGSGYVSGEVRARLALDLPREATVGRRVLAVGEQGIGDELMFASMLADLQAEASAVTLVCDPRLRRLFTASFPDIDVRDPKTFKANRPPVDVVLAVGSLGRLYRNRLEDFPGEPFLATPPEVRARWAARLGPKTTRLRVGISWRGGTKGTGSADRSMELETLRPLLERADCEFVSLQYGDNTEALAAANATLARPIRFFPPAEIDDFEELAGLVQGLDLVVSVQTALVHLTGGLGAPALVMVPQAPEWRYAVLPDRMAWYRSVQLLRQGPEGGWTSVIERVMQRLDAWAPPQA